MGQLFSSRNKPPTEAELPIEDLLPPKFKLFKQYNPTQEAIGQWVNQLSLPLERFGHTALFRSDLNSKKSYIVIYGGKTRDEYVVDDTTTENGEQDVYEFCIEEKQWYCHSGTKLKQLCDVPPARTSHAAVINQKTQKMYIFGGVSTKTQTTYNDLYEFDFATHRWKRLFSKAATSSSTNANLSVKNITPVSTRPQKRETISIGDEDEQEDSSRTTSTQAPVPQKRRTFLTEPPLARYGHSMVTRQDADTKKNYLVIFGGIDENFVYNSMYEYCIEDETWALIEPEQSLKPSPRFYHSAAITRHLKHLKHDVLVVYGGCFSREQYLNDCCLFSFEQNRWFQLLNQSGPPPPLESIYEGFMVHPSGNLCLVSSDQIYCLNIYSRRWFSVPIHGADGDEKSLTLNKIHSIVPCVNAADVEQSTDKICLFQESDSYMFNSLVELDSRVWKCAETQTSVVESSDIA